jgi:hypothetical protein
MPNILDNVYRNKSYIIFSDKSACNLFCVSLLKKTEDEIGPIVLSAKIFVHSWQEGSRIITFITRTMTPT